jgi:hypothetical protein
LLKPYQPHARSLKVLSGIRRSTVLFFLALLLIDRAVLERQEHVDTIHDLPLNLKAKGSIISKPVGWAE